MCTSDIYRSIGHDGVHRETREIHRCTAFKRGIPCDPIVYRHPVAAPRPTVTPSPASSVGHSAPVDIPNPSPRYSSTEAEAQEAQRVRQQRSSPHCRGGVLAHDHPSSHLHLVPPLEQAFHRQQQHRIVIVEAPPTSRTPPQAFDAPRTAPSSPSFPSIPAGEDNLRYRPVIVDERPRESRDRDSKHHHQRVRIEVPGSGLEVPSGSAAHHQSQRQSSGGHRRQASDGSHRSRGGSPAEEESRIAQANLKISLRPTQPLSSRRPAPAPVYIRPTVDLPATAGLGLVSPPAEPVDDEENEEAREQRLRERMMPHRRATIGAGSRRHRVEYQDGMYRLE
ncbi:unnamed protein product [Parascedosporium putredinis]|uniref:Uncharacterized protein n=1 Tax=Parascedosporium putredinis TaxID=1442378 RepID=A0A9P1H7R7_9PEZI|nr:unnamed protein product [Parascedosporium putredinis]CAI8000118.1 unnamed protein product [Parascedosporium putredinis]